MDAAASDSLPMPLRYALRALFVLLLAVASAFCLFLAWPMRGNGMTALLIAALGVTGMVKPVRFVRRILRRGTGV